MDCFWAADGLSTYSPAGKSSVSQQLAGSFSGRSCQPATHLLSPVGATVPIPAAWEMYTTTAVAERRKYFFKKYIPN